MTTEEELAMVQQQMSGKAPPESGRREAVWGLVKQGVRSPEQILDYLNFDEDGTPTGDFTIEEVKQLMPR